MNVCSIWGRRNLAGLLLLVLVANPAVFVDADDDLQDPVTVDASQIQKFSTDELRSIAAPIALYPDALLAQVLPASAFPMQVVAAYRQVQSRANPGDPPADPTWDSSVIALLNYPTVLKKLNDNLSWTEQLGVAATYQMDELSDTIQQIRAEAQAAGNLVSNDQQQVAQVDDNICIVPTDPQLI